MFRQWGALYRIDWDPILTYGRRRAELMDRFESEVSPVAFIDGAEQLGVAVKSPDVRLTVDRAGLTVECGPSRQTVSELTLALQTTFEVMDPKNVWLSHSSTACSVSLAKGNVGDLHEAFAHTLTGFKSIGGHTAVDAAGLMDVVSDAGEKAQVEWGIVGADELLYRLNNPDAGRVALPPVTAQVPRAMFAPVPEVAVLAVISWLKQQRSGKDLVGPADVLAMIEAEVKDAKGIVSDLAKAFIVRSKQGG